MTLPTFAVDEYFSFPMVGSIYSCFYLSMLPNATECRAEIPPSKPHPRKCQMTALMGAHCANACLFLVEDPLPKPAQTHLRITSVSGKLIQFFTLPSATAITLGPWLPSSSASSSCTRQCYHPTV